MAKESTAPPIKQAGGVIIEGNHRYVAGRIVRRDPPIEEGAAPFTQRPIRDWKDVAIDSVDWNPPK